MNLLISQQSTSQMCKETVSNVSVGIHGDVESSRNLRDTAREQ